MEVVIKKERRGPWLLSPRKELFPCLMQVGIHMWTCMHVFIDKCTISYVFVS